MDPPSFNNYSAGNILRLIRQQKSDFWSSVRERQALKVFHAAARRVPAYKDFLIKHRVNPIKIKTFSDFTNVPTVDKKNYLRAYSLRDLCWDGEIGRSYVFSSTSGSTGEPFYFPRTEGLAWESAIIHELFIRNSRISGPTLVIVGFGMGVWIGGMITYQAFELASRRGRSLSIIAPGVNKSEIIKALKNLSPKFRETVLVGYPPFVKDVVDEARAYGVDFEKLSIRFLFAAESFSEDFRDYIAKEAGIKNPCLDTLNVYGTSDMGTMAYETPVGIMMRRLAVGCPPLFKDFFASTVKTPTLAQYNPLFITFEAPGGEVLLTGNNAIPLIRYSLGDRGGEMSFAVAEEKLEKHGLSLKREAAKVGVAAYVYELPFVSVYERSDLSTSLYGLKIYPEVIRAALIKMPLARALTGKFTMATKLDRKHNQYWEINLELCKNKKANKNLKKMTLDKIIGALCEKNSEFRELHSHLGDRANPRLVFWAYEHPLYFQPGAKQRWVVK